MTFLGMLGVLFIGLKITGYIDWSWWLVTLPIWGGYALFVIGVLIAFVAEVRSDMRKDGGLLDSIKKGEIE